MKMSSIVAIVLAGALQGYWSTYALADGAVERGHPHGPEEVAGTHPHGPEEVAAQAVPQASGSTPAVEGSMEVQTERMQALHKKFLAAKTDTVRRQLMTQHMQAMQDGMTLMQGQSGGQGMMGNGGQVVSGMMNCPGSIDQMRKRTQLMEAMLQLMKDQQAAAHR